MLGLARFRARARSISLSALIAYLGVLMLLTFGHQCASGGSGLSHGDTSARASFGSGTLTQAHSATSVPEHTCLACVLQPQMDALDDDRSVTYEPALETVAVAVPPSTHPPLLIFSSRTSRGPPTS